MNVLLGFLIAMKMLSVSILMDPIHVNVNQALKGTEKRVMVCTVRSKMIYQIKYLICNLSFLIPCFSIKL